MRTERKKRLYRLAAWTWSWVATLAIATFGPKYIWDGHVVLTTLAVLANLGNGLAMIAANRNLYADFDELEQRIHLEALGLTLGLTVIFGITYSLLDATDLIPFSAHIGILVGFAGMAYLITVWINTKRYA